MPDGESVITHLQIIHTWAEFARERDLQFFTKKHLEDIAQWAYDAIDLLKDQQKQIEQMNFIYGFVYGGKVKEIHELIRCKDCKHGEPCNDGEIYCEKDIGTIETAVHKPDWYCADGEAKA